MAVFKIVGIALMAVAASLVLRAYRPELGLQIAVAAGVLILMLTLDELIALSDAGTLPNRPGLSKSNA